MAEFDRAYLVCATQRSGSTLLCELLKDTGVAGRPEEYFEATRDTGRPPHPGVFLEGLPATGLGIRDDPEPPEAPEYSALAGITDYREHLRRTFARGTTPNGIFGAKLMFNQIAELHALAGELPEYAGLEAGELLERLFAGPRYVWVSRRDTVRQAVSMWKALQTRHWRAGANGRRSSPEYRFAGVDHLVRRFAAEEQGWATFFARHQITPLKVAYEDDLERDPEGAVRRVLQWIDASPTPDWRPIEPLRRQSDPTSDEWVAAYHRDLG